VNIKKEIIKNSDGYGYKIYKNNILFIVQNYFPAISGNKTMTENQAIMISNLIIRKLEDKPDELPTVTVKEVEEILEK